MDRSPVERILDDWDQVANRAAAPPVAPRRGGTSVGFATFGLVPLLAAALAVAVGVAWIGGRIGGSSGNPGGSGSLPVSTGSADSSPATTAPAIGPSILPSAQTACAADALQARVTGWEGAAGNRIATVDVTLDGGTACTTQRVWRPEFVDGSGTIRIEGGIPTASGTIEIAPGVTLTTLVQLGNDCLPPPTAPVSIAFILDDGTRLVATPLSADDVTTPPCNGPGQAAAISMHPWSRP